MAGRVFPFEVDETSDVPLWVQLRQRLIYLIESGYYQPGEQLPTVRGLASDISINYNTVNKAYLSLVSDGYIESTRGRGAFVRDIDAEQAGENASEIDELLDDCIRACHDLGLSYDDIQKCFARKIMQRNLEIHRQSNDSFGSCDEDAASARGRIVTVNIERKTPKMQKEA